MGDVYPEGKQTTHTNSKLEPPTDSTTESSTVIGLLKPTKSPAESPTESPTLEEVKRYDESIERYREALNKDVSVFDGNWNRLEESNESEGEPELVDSSDDEGKKADLCYKCFDSE